jgi:hypothetical protein
LTEIGEFLGEKKRIWREREREKNLGIGALGMSGSTGIMEGREGVCNSHHMSLCHFARLPNKIFTKANDNWDQ